MRCALTVLATIGAVSLAAALFIGFMSGALWLTEQAIAYFSLSKPAGAMVFITILLLPWSTAYGVHLCRETRE